MKENWTEIRIQVPAEAVDLVCDDLVALGCVGTTVEERALDTFIPPDPNEPMTGECVIKVYFPSSLDVEMLRVQVRERLEWIRTMVPSLEAVLPEVVEVRDEDWAEGWKQHFSAMKIGERLVVKPSWEPYEPAAQEVVVTIDPGMAFGTGTHGTTRLCLETLASLFDGVAVPQRVLDVGTGSGILAIAAAALGTPRVLACDIDPEACRITTENAAQNEMADRIEVTLDPLETLEGDFDVVIANILAEENVRLAGELVSRVSVGGALILSGILKEKEAFVVEGFSSMGLTGPEVFYMDEWVCLVYRKEK